MPRRNLYYLVFTAIVSIVCYLRADSANRGHYEGMKETFFEALGRIREYYLYDVNERSLFDGAMQGMVRGLDKNSSFMNREEALRFQQMIHQQFGGIGIEVAWDDKEQAIVVLSPIVGSPAYDAGILAGDKILKIEDTPTKGLNLDQAVARLKGKEGEDVRVTVARAGEPELVEYTLKRAIIHMQSVLGDSRKPDDTWRFTLDEDPQLGYIRVTQFGHETLDELKRALEQCKEAGVRGLILDLRNNPGGLLTSATDICDLFLEKGLTVVQTVNRQGKEIERFRANGNAPYPSLPLAILVNGNSASAAEIVSACLQDNHRAVIVGERTFGKGTVQSPFKLNDDSILKLTIYEYRSPLGRNIHRREDAKDTDVWGVSPDPGYDVPLTPEAEIAIAMRRRERDVVRRGKPKPDASATADGNARTSATATPSGTVTPSGIGRPTPTASATSSGAKLPAPTASPTSSAKPSGTGSPAAQGAAGGKGEGGAADAESEPEIPADDPQLRRAIEHFKAKPAAVRAA